LKLSLHASLRRRLPSIGSWKSRNRRLSAANNLTTTKLLLRLMTGAMASSIKRISSHSWESTDAWPATKTWC
jgi:hypothetical protein